MWKFLLVFIQLLQKVIGCLTNAHCYKSWLFTVYFSENKENIEILHEPK